MSRLVAFALLCAPLVLPAGATVAPVVRINQVQSVGTHNSFDVEPSRAEKTRHSGSGLVVETTLEYSFAPLGWQFGRQEVRRVELDLWADPAARTPRCGCARSPGGRPCAPQTRT